MTNRVYHHTQHGMAVVSKPEGSRRVFVNFSVSYIRKQTFNTLKAADAFLIDLGYVERKKGGEA